MHRVDYPNCLFHVFLTPKQTECWNYCERYQTVSQGLPIADKHIRWRVFGGIGLLLLEENPSGGDIDHF
jgi:hypothetical protein